MRREDFAWILVAFALVAVCVVGGLNTRIGWPWTNWSRGGWVAVGYASMCSTIGIALALMVWSAWTGKPCRLTVVLVLLVVAAVVLQWLPRSAAGIQFLPVSPWTFHGWIPLSISACSWLALALVVLALVCWDRAVGFPVTAVLFLAVNLPLSFWSLDPFDVTAIPVAAVDPFPEYRNRRGELKARQDEAHRLLEALRRDQDELAERLRRLGVRSSADLRHIPAARPLAEELAEVVHLIRDQQKVAQRLGEATIEAGSRLRRLQRRGVIEPTGDEEVQFIRTGVELTERPWSDQSDPMLLEVDGIVDEMLGKPEAKQQKRFIRRKDAPGVEKCGHADSHWGLRYLDLK
jgi:hypothetical protein